MPCERITSSTTARIPKLTTLEMSNDLESLKITCETGTQGGGSLKFHVDYHHYDTARACSLKDRR